MRPPEVADGVYRLGTKWANFHLVRDGAEWALVDGGYSGYLPQLEAALGALGSSLGAVSAVIVTHHHVDHAGTAEALRSHVGARVFVHEADADIVSGARRSHVPPGFYRQSWRPSMMRYLLHTVRVGGARYSQVSEVQRLGDDQTLDVPGCPRVFHVPGHTAGHCSVLLAERGVLLVGDALVNFDYASGERGVGLHRFNEDRMRAFASLARLEALEADTVLFGHGDPSRGGIRAAVETARQQESR